MGVAALCSSKFVASNAAVQHMLLPSPLAIDLFFRDGGVLTRSAKVTRAASRGWSILKSLGRRRRNSASTRGASESFICRAKSFEEAGDSAGEEYQGEDRRPISVRFENQADAGAQELEVKAAVSVRYGAPGDRFRRSPSPDFSDEFFSKMMEALEASHNATPRVHSDLRSSAQHLDAAAGGSDSDSPPRTPSGGYGVDACKEQLPSAVLGMGSVQLPSSIKKLRRRGAANCAIRNAFASMLYMIKVVQSHALQIRQALFSEWDVQEVLLLVHREMHSSFVWLFQEVFACTPKLMVSVMLLLANFTVYSTGANIPIAITSETPAPIASFLSRNPQPVASTDFISFTKAPTDAASPHLDAAGSGGNMNNISRSSSGFDGDSWLNGALHPRFMFSQKDFTSPSPVSHLQESDREMDGWVERTVKDLDVRLEQETTRRLVAPVVAHLESDNYACFDRTDLEYQHGISLEPHNSLLLANYAHFLFVVRHDNDRAEGYFHQAMQADPMDATILGRFASFLWLARGNRSGAERAYKAAMAADPENSFPAGSYAHFLWHSGDGENSMR